MHITFKGKEIELVFGMKFLRQIDSRLGIKMEEATIGQGVSMLPVGLEMGNPLVIGETILAATSHLKKAPTLNEVDDILDEVAEEVGLEEFGQQVIEELGKRPMTRGIVEVVEQPKKIKKKEK